MLNQVNLIGRIGQDIEVRYMSSGEAVTNVSLATTEKWKDKNTGEQKESTEWHRLVIYGKLAEIMGQYVKKGDLLFVAGKLKTKKFTDKEGVERYQTEIVVAEMKMLGGKQESTQQSAQPARGNTPPSRTQQPARQMPQSVADLDDDIPF